MILILILIAFFVGALLGAFGMTLVQSTEGTTTMTHDTTHVGRGQTRFNLMRNGEVFRAVCVDEVAARHVTDMVWRKRDDSSAESIRGLFNDAGIVEDFGPDDVVVPLYIGPLERKVDQMNDFDALEVLEVDQWTATGNLKDHSWEELKHRGLHLIEGGDSKAAQIIFGGHFRFKLVKSSDKPSIGDVWFIQDLHGNPQPYKENLDSSD